MIDLLWLVAFIILNILVFYTRTIEAFFKKKKHLFYLNLPLEIVKVYIKLFFNIKRFFLIEIIPFLKWCFYRFFTGRGTFYNFDLFNDFKWRVKTRVAKIVFVVVIFWGFFIFFNFIRNFLVVWQDLYFFFHKKSVMLFFLFFLDHFNTFFL